MPSTESVAVTDAVANCWSVTVTAKLNAPGWDAFPLRLPVVEPSDSPPGSEPEDQV